MRKCAACRGSYLLSLAAGAWIYLVEPAEIIRAKIAELVADGVIAGAALSLFRRKLLLLLFQQVPIKLVIFTHRNQQWAATNNKPQNGIKMGTHRAFRHQLPQILGRTCHRPLAYMEKRKARFGGNSCMGLAHAVSGPEGWVLSFEVF